MKMQNVSSGGNVVDKESGAPVSLSSVKDNDGKSVLRIVDSAPFLLEYGRFDEAVHNRLNIFGINEQVLAENPSRKYLCISNLSTDTPVYIHFNSVEDSSGIILGAKENYEMSTLKGNLYHGDVFVQSSGGFVNLFDDTLVEQGGATTSGRSSSLIRTRIYPLEVSADTVYKISVPEEEDVYIRSVVLYDTANSESGTGAYDGATRLMDTQVKECTFMTDSDTVEIAVSFCKGDLAAEITPQETKDAGILIVKSDAEINITEGV